MNWRPLARHGERMMVVVAIMLQLASCVHGFASLARAPIVPAGQRFTCTAIRLWDGDGPIWCEEGYRIRLARINARELDGSCRRGAPCPLADGIAAREHLADLLGGVIGRTADGHIVLRPVRLACLSDGWGKGDRTAAWCSLRRRDLSAAMIHDGFAAAWPRARPSRD